MDEEFSRRKLQHPKQKKFPYFFATLFLLINCVTLGFLIYFNVQAESKFEKQLSTIESRVSQIDQQANVVASTDSTVPRTGQISSEQEQVASTTESTTSSTSTAAQATSTSETQTATGSPSTGTAYYTVKAGDTLSVIAEQNNLSLQALMNLNDLTDPTVYIGQILSLQ